MTLWHVILLALLALAGPTSSSWSWSSWTSSSASSSVFVEHAFGGRLRHGDGQCDWLVELAASRLHRYDGADGHPGRQKQKSISVNIMADQ